MEDRLASNQGPRGWGKLQAGLYIKGFTVSLKFDHYKRNFCIYVLKFNFTDIPIEPETEITLFLYNN